MKLKGRAEIELLIQILFFVIATLTVSYFWHDNPFLFLLLLIELLIGEALLYEKGDEIFFIVGATAGPLGEIIAIIFGAWRYSNPDLIIPIWLPVLWGFATIFIKKAAITLTKILKI